MKSYLWYILGISWGYLWVILGISLAYLGQWTYLRYILGYLGQILGITLAYLWHIIGNLGDILGSFCVHKAWAPKGQRLSVKSAKRKCQRRKAWAPKAGRPAQEKASAWPSSLFQWSNLFSWFFSFLFVQIFPFYPERQIVPNGSRFYISFLDGLVFNFNSWLRAYFVLSFNWFPCGD